MARAARQSGADPDDEDYEEFEEMLEQAEGAQVRDTFTETTRAAKQKGHSYRTSKASNTLLFSSLQSH